MQMTKVAMLCHLTVANQISISLIGLDILFIDAYSIAQYVGIMTELICDCKE